MVFFYISWDFISEEASKFKRLKGICGMMEKPGVSCFPKLEMNNDTLFLAGNRVSVFCSTETWR